LQEELHGTGCAERNAIRLIAKRSLLRILPVVAFCRAQLGLLCRQMQVAVSGRKKTRQERATALAQSHPNLTRWAYARMLAVVSYTGSLARLLACCLFLVAAWRLLPLAASACSVACCCRSPWVLPLLLATNRNKMHRRPHRPTRQSGARSTRRTVRRTPFRSHFILEPIILPRQARDKHRES
jgi:hypothetical protein